MLSKREKRRRDCSSRDDIFSFFWQLVQCRHDAHLTYTFDIAHLSTAFLFSLDIRTWRSDYTYLNSGKESEEINCWSIEAAEENLDLSSRSCDTIIWSPMFFYSTSAPVQIHVEREGERESEWITTNSRWKKGKTPDGADKSPSRTTRFLSSFFSKRHDRSHSTMSRAFRAAPCWRLLCLRLRISRFLWRRTWSGHVRSCRDETYQRKVERWRWNIHSWNFRSVATDRIFFEMYMYVPNTIVTRLDQTTHWQKDSSHLVE